MSVGLAGNPMAKKKTGRPKSPRRDATAKIDVEVLRQAKHVALYDGVSLAEFLTEAVRPIVERRMRQIASEMLKRPEK